MEIKDRLKILRKKKKLSQVAFGKAIGISGSQIACYETGYREITERTITEICRKFHVNKEWLLDGIEPMSTIPEQDIEVIEAISKISISNNEKLKSIAKDLTKLNEKNLDLVYELVIAVVNNQQYSNQSNE